MLLRVSIGPAPPMLCALSHKWFFRRALAKLANDIRKWGNQKCRMDNEICQTGFICLLYVLRKKKHRKYGAFVTRKVEIGTIPPVILCRVLFEQSVHGFWFVGLQKECDADCFTCIDLIGVPQCRRGKGRILVFEPHHIFRRLSISQPCGEITCRRRGHLAPVEDCAKRGQCA